MRFHLPNGKTITAPGFAYLVIARAETQTQAQARVSGGAARDRDRLTYSNALFIRVVRGASA